MSKNINRIPLQCDACDAVLPNSKELRWHIKCHGHTCAQCSQSFKNHDTLGYHAAVTGHCSYSCRSCDSTFSRRDVMLRHKKLHTAVTIKYSCPHCKNWRAPNGFARKDHLVQHMRNYHHIEDSKHTQNRSSHWSDSPEDAAFHGYCIHESCTLFRLPLTRNEKVDLAKQPLFPSRSAFTKHMRSEHDRSTFSCTVAGCKRVNGKGFFQKRAWIKHMKAKHDINPMEEADDKSDGVMETARMIVDYLAAV